MKRWLLGLLGYTDWPDDLEDTVPDEVTFTGPVVLGPRGEPGEFGNRYWYLNARYGSGPDHQHIEIKLDTERARQLANEMATMRWPE